jgi:hypothetical protein
MLKVLFKYNFWYRLYVFIKQCENRDKFGEKKISVCKTFANKPHFNHTYIIV